MVDMRQATGQLSLATRAVRDGLRTRLGGAERMRVICVLACVLGLSGADAATVGASATELRASLGISNTDIGLLVAVTSLVGALQACRSACSRIVCDER